MHCLRSAANATHPYCAFGRKVATPQQSQRCSRTSGRESRTGIHVLRLALSGALERHPGLKLVIGHMGEALPFMLDRIDETAAATTRTMFGRSLKQMLTDQVWITTSGFFTMVPFMAAPMAFGVDRLMFSVGLPFCLERPCSGVSGRAAGIARSQGENRAWQCRQTAALAHVNKKMGGRSLVEPSPIKSA